MKGLTELEKGGVEYWEDNKMGLLHIELYKKAQGGEVKRKSEKMSKEEWRG